jgi:hypothetical protein
MIIEANGEFYLLVEHAEIEMDDEAIRLNQIIAALENAIAEPSRSNPQRTIYGYGGIGVIVEETEFEDEMAVIVTVFRIR